MKQGEAQKVISKVRALTDLKSCSMRRDLQWGRRIHAKVVESGNESNLYVVTALIKMYGKCGSMVDARRVFDTVEQPDVVSWTALLLGYAENGEGLIALDLFSKMKVHCVPDSVTYVAALKACTSFGVMGDGTDCLDRGREIHSEIGRHLTDYVQSTLIDMYAKCGSMVEARHVFDNIKQPDVVSWTALLLGYAENGKGLVALELFSRMKANGCVPNSVTYVAALKACTSLAVKEGESGIRNGLERGRQIHSEIGCHLNLHVQSTLIDMYSKCASMAEARHVFDNIRQPNVVSWNALLLGYADNRDGFAVLELFPRMRMQGCLPDSLSYIGALKACAALGALPLGRKFHLEISEFTSHVLSSLVDFYAKCGSMVEAQQVFDQHVGIRNLATWNALLAGYGSCGDTGSAFGLFEAMQDAGLCPNAVTFVCMLLCCSHAGLVQKAREFFEAMPVQYGVAPTVMHYTCMVDVLGRANQLNEVIVMLRRMPCSPDAVTWRAVLGACCKWKNVEIGTLAFRSLVDMDEKDAAAYVLMAQIYGSRGMWAEQEKVSRMRIKSGAWEALGQAYVTDELGKTVNFVVGEPDLPVVEKGMKQLCEAMKVHGYVAESYSMSNPVANAGKGEALCGHSERRAVVYGIVRTLSGEPVRVFKNMRMCHACHGLTKVISKLSGRVIMVRDPSRFHVMVNGSCSCGDYW